MNYYDLNAKKFIESTISIDMSEFYAPFLEKLPENAKILDIGCGPGRDVKYFKGCGHDVVGVEPSVELANYAREYSKCPIHLSTIEDIELAQKFDGIWACASLLHLSTEDLISILVKIQSLLNSKGAFYCSFKLGKFEGERDGRFYNDQNQDSIRRLLPEGMAVCDLWITEDKRSDSDEQWVNLVGRKL